MESSSIQTTTTDRNVELKTGLARKHLVIVWPTNGQIPGFSGGNYQIQKFDRGMELECRKSLNLYLEEKRDLGTG